MAANPCKLCENEPAAFLVTELTTGDTAYIGLLCLPPFVMTVWEDAGLPALTINVEEPADDTPDEPAEKPAEEPAPPAPKGRRKGSIPTDEARTLAHEIITADDAETAPSDA